MAKRGKTVRRPVREHKSSTARKRAPAEVVAKKENSRLKHELAEAREQQAATSELLKVIGRSTLDLQPVFETRAENAVRLCSAERGLVFRFDGQLLRFTVGHNVSPEFRDFLEGNPIVPGRNSNAGRAALERRTVHNLDVQNDPEYSYGGSRVDPYRTVLAVPMLRGGEMFGVFVIYRHGVRPFTDNQMALMETFADQAVIAIGNVRLFDEVQARTEDLRESLQQQTATADVLKVISRSTFDLKTVVDTLIGSAAQLCEADRGMIFLREDNHYRVATNYGFSPELEAFAKANPLPIDGRSTTARAAASGVPVQAVDLLADETQSELALQYQRLG